MTSQAPLPQPRDRVEGPAGRASFFSRPSTARILPFATYMVFIAIVDGLERLGWSADALRWVYPAKIAAVVAVLFAYRRHYAELAWHGLTRKGATVAVATGIVVLLLWISLDLPWMQVGTSAGFNPTGTDGRIDWALVLLRVAGAALVVPIMEELFWRSFLLRWIEDPDFQKVHAGKVGLKAIFITVLMFGFEHNLWLAGIVAGMAYTVVYMRSTTLWSPILAHAVTNALLGVWVVVTKSWTYW